MDRKPLIPAGSAPGGSPMPSPGDHLRTIIGLLRPEGLDLARRWIAALMLAPEEDREAIVEAVERRMAQEYAAPMREMLRLGIVHPPEDRDGHTEQVEAEYAMDPGAAASERKPVRGRGTRGVRKAGP